MLEIDESLAEEKPTCEIHPLSIGGKADPVRLVFNVAGGAAINASIIDMGNRFRLVVNEVDAIPAEKPLPKLPVARVLWNAKPNLKVAAAAWILAGGAHHTVFSKAVTAEYMEDFSEMSGIEYVLIDENTTIHQFKNELRWNEMYYKLAKGL
jgi:L-arabinose isomerase